MNTDFDSKPQATARSRRPFVFMGSGSAPMGHPGMTAGAYHRNPSPRAMMPRRISRVPPWMVSLGAIRVV